MRVSIVCIAILFLCSSAWAGSKCVWACSATISNPDTSSAHDSGSSGSARWAWQFVYSASHLHIAGSMSADCYRCTTNLAKAASGNGKYLIWRIAICSNPIEDIEGTARNEFKARAELNDDSFARAGGSKRIKASKMSLDCHCHGAVEATANGPGSGNNGTTTITIGVVSTTLYWSEGGSVAKVFQASDGGTGGKSPETIICQTNLELALSVGWFNDSGQGLLTNSKVGLTVYGTCNGACKTIQPVLVVSEGY